MNGEDLSQQLAEARRVLALRDQAYWRVPKGHAERVQAHAAVREATAQVASFHRRLAEVTGDEYVIPLNLPFAPSPSVSGASLEVAELGDAILTFNAVRRLPDGSLEDCGTAALRFHLPILVRFGLPNDEAQRGHPLFTRGFDLFFDGAEVLNSRLRLATQQQNAVVFPDSSGFVGECRHFLFQFHDDSFECLSHSFTILDPKGVGGGLTSRCS